MSMIKCPECGKEVSSEALNCPNCGYPMKQKEVKEKGKKPIVICAGAIIAVIAVVAVFFLIKNATTYDYLYDKYGKIGSKEKNVVKNIDNPELEAGEIKIDKTTSVSYDEHYDTYMASYYNDKERTGVALTTDGDGTIIGKLISLMPEIKKGWNYEEDEEYERLLVVASEKYEEIKEKYINKYGDEYKIMEEDELEEGEEGLYWPKEEIYIKKTSGKSHVTASIMTPAVYIEIGKRHIDIFREKKAGQ